jgi:hypothetical protein
MAASWKEDRIMANGHTEKVTAVGGVAVVMGIELSKKGRLVALRSPLADRISLHRLPAADAKGLLAVAERARTAVAAALGTKVIVALCYEAGYNGFWLHRVLTDLPPVAWTRV